MIDEQGKEKLKKEILARTALMGNTPDPLDGFRQGVWCAVDYLARTYELALKPSTGAPPAPPPE